MIGGLRPYPEYKESGVFWLGRIGEALGGLRKLRMGKFECNACRGTNSPLPAALLSGLPKL